MKDYSKLTLDELKKLAEDGDIDAKAAMMELLPDLAEAFEDTVGGEPPAVTGARNRVAQAAAKSKDFFRTFFNPKVNQAMTKSVKSAVKHEAMREVGKGGIETVRNGICSCIVRFSSNKEDAVALVESPLFQNVLDGAIASLSAYGLMSYGMRGEDKDHKVSRLMSDTITNGGVAQLNEGLGLFELLKDMFNVTAISNRSTVQEIDAELKAKGLLDDNSVM